MTECRSIDAFEMLSRRHALTILWALQQEKRPMRFTEIKAAVGVNAVTLSERLNDLEAEGIVLRRAYDEAPPRVEYELTEKGVGLFPILDAIECWSEAHGSEPGADQATTGAAASP